MKSSLSVGARAAAAARAARWHVHVRGSISFYAAEIERKVLISNGADVKKKSHLTTPEWLVAGKNAAKSALPVYDEDPANNKINLMTV